MDAINKRRENLSWPDQNQVNAQLEAIRELAKELRTDYPTDTLNEPTNWGNKARNRRNALICAQFLDNGAFSLISGSEWLELFDLLGFSVDKETHKRFASHLNWYSFWYADFKPRLSSKYAQRIHWYVQNFLFCLRNKLQTEKDYREGKYGAKGQAYFMETEQQPATRAEMSRISTETAKADNVSDEEEKTSKFTYASIEATAEDMANRAKSLKCFSTMELPNGIEIRITYGLSVFGTDYYKYEEWRRGKCTFSIAKLTVDGIAAGIAGWLNIEKDSESTQSLKTPHKVA